MPEILGTLLVTSGKSILGDRLTDWAFVKISEEAEMAFGPNSMLAVPSTLDPANYQEVADTGGTINEGELINEFGSLTDGQFCTKIGRTTKVTSGVCQGLTATCSWRADEVRYDHDDRAVHLQTRPTLEHIIMTKKIGETEYVQESFAKDGDSGSLMLDEMGTVNGLLFAGTINRYVCIFRDCYEHG
ncbi:hypothetical protein N7454_005531 [Penicillium verhagenii]|nr:hypothetical protein N7454_005531 [Penicillium verhagenii]